MATFTVTTSSDVVDANDGELSLREALTLANANPDSDLIMVPIANAKSFEIRLIQGALEITSDVTIQGEANGRISISGDANNDGDANAGDSRIFNISGNGTDAVLSGLTLTEGFSSGFGGAVYTGSGVASLTVINSTIEDSMAGVSGGGIGINSAATALTITDSTIRDNTATNDGGGIRAGGLLTISGSTISGNSADDGGGIYLGFQSGVVNNTITNSTIDGNAATGAGGGLSIFSSTVTLTNSTITDNDAGTDGTGSGGGIRFNASPNYGLTLNNSVLALNSAEFGVDLDTGSGEIVDANNSFFEVDISGTGILDTDNSNIFSGNLGLGALQYNGGTVRTRAISDESDLINAGDNALTGMVATDANGNPRVTAGTVDIGASELQLVVTTLDDVVSDTDNVLSLREALSIANEDVGADTITFGVGGTIRLGAGLGDLDITSDVTIDGGGTITINGDVDSSGTANAGDSRIFTIGGTDTDAVLTDLTLTNGYTASNGGAIYTTDAASLTINNSTLENNTAFSQGGAIITTSSVTTLTINDSTIRDNIANGMGLTNGGGRCHLQRRYSEHLWFDGIR